jgi:hypothetical protein
MSIGSINSTNQATSSQSSEEANRTTIDEPDKTEDKGKERNKPIEKTKQGFLKTIWSKVKKIFKGWLSTKPAPKTRKLKTLTPKATGDDGEELFGIKEVTATDKKIKKKSLHSCGCGAYVSSSNSNKADHSHDGSHGHDGGHSCGSHSCGGHGCGSSCGAGCGAACGGCGA